MAKVCFHGVNSVASRTVSQLPNFLSVALKHIVRGLPIPFQIFDFSFPFMCFMVCRKCTLNEQFVLLLPTISLGNTEIPCRSIAIIILKKQVMILTRNNDSNLQYGKHFFSIFRALTLSKY